MATASTAVVKTQSDRILDALSFLSREAERCSEDMREILDASHGLLTVVCRHCDKNKECSSFQNFNDLDNHDKIEALSQMIQSFEKTDIVSDQVDIDIILSSMHKILTISTIYFLRCQALETI